MRNVGIDEYRNLRQTMCSTLHVDARIFSKPARPATGGIAFQDDSGV